MEALGDMSSEIPSLTHLTLNPDYSRPLINQGVEGIVNGMDVEEWDPALDKLLTVKYDKVRSKTG